MVPDTLIVTLREGEGIAASPLASPRPVIDDVPGYESRTSDWFALLKPRVMTLVVFTGAVGLAIAPGHLHPFLAAVAILCIGVGAGAAGAINMWYDRDIDAVMRRTERRPIPAGLIEPAEALSFGVTLAIGAVVVLGLATNVVAGACLAVSIGFYVFVYTMWLKRRTPQNIVIGGAAGAFPPVIGWAAVTGHIGLLPVLLFAIVFCWTPPHFWALSLYASGDYARAGVPMLPVVSGPRATRRHIAAYAAVLLPLSLLPWALHLAGLIYGVITATAGILYLASAILVWRDRQDATGLSLNGDRAARLSFRMSLIYLTAVFAAIAADRLLG